MRNIYFLMRDELCGVHIFLDPGRFLHRLSVQSQLGPVADLTGLIDPDASSAGGRLEHDV
jgi:hypothetical protein